MPSTPHSHQMQTIVSYVAPLMKASGFRKQRNTFNRAMSDGLVHVLNFQMGSYEPIPPTIREEDQEEYRQTLARLRGFASWYGWFTVNVGIFVPEMDELSRALLPYAGNARARPRFIVEPYCHIRERLGRLAHGEDRWWRLEGDSEIRGVLTANLVERYALPFLDRFPDRVAILALSPQETEEIWFQGPARLILGVMASHGGDNMRARELLQAHFDESRSDGSHPDHLRYVERVAQRLGLQVTVPRA